MSCETKISFLLIFTLFSYHLLFSLLEFSFPINKIDVTINFSKRKKRRMEIFKKEKFFFFWQKMSQNLSASF